MREVTGWAAATPGAAPAPWAFARRDPRPDDVVVRVTHCGVCATDLHAPSAQATRPGSRSSRGTR